MVVQTVLVELPQLQFIDSCRHFNCVAEAVVVPQVQLRLWTSLCSCSDGLFNSGGASDSVHRQSLGRLVVLRDGYATFSSCVTVVMKGFFDAFCFIFRAPSRSWAPVFRAFECSQL